MSTLTWACRIINDKVKTRLPIQCGLLELLLFKVTRYFDGKQPYLECLYQTLFAICYYGLFRVGELTYSPHVIKAKDVHMAHNKDKLLIILYSSKTHSIAVRPQKVKITSNISEWSGSYHQRHFCPFNLMRRFMRMRGDVLSPSEPFFLFSDQHPVQQNTARKLLKLLLIQLGLDHTLYDMHSLRIGRSTDLIKFHYQFDEVKWMGWWKSNVILKYIREP